MPGTERSWNWETRDVAVAGFEQVVAHALTSMMARVGLTTMGLSAFLHRDRVRVIFGTGLPAHFLTASLTVMPRVDTSSILTMKSPLSRRPLGGRIFNRGDNFDEAVFLSDFHTQTAEFAAGGFFQVGVSFVHIFRMRVRPATIPFMAPSNSSESGLS